MEDSRGGGAGKLQIYFAGAIRGGRQDALLYARMIGFLSGFGTVLTSHVGDDGLLAEERFLSEGEIFARDMAWLKTADIVIAEVSTPSLGVGYEIAVAESLGKEIVCLYRTRPGARLSAMIAGSRGCVVREYARDDEAEEILAEIMHSFLEKSG